MGCGSGNWTSTLWHAETAFENNKLLNVVRLHHLRMLLMENQFNIFFLQIRWYKVKFDFNFYFFTNLTGKYNNFRIFPPQIWHMCSFSWATKPFFFIKEFPLRVSKANHKKICHVNMHRITSKLMKYLLFAKEMLMFSSRIVDFFYVVPT